MGLIATLRSAAAAAFRVAGDVKLAATFRHGPTGTALAGQTTVSWAVTKQINLVELLEHEQTSEVAFDTKAAKRHVKFIALVAEVGMRAEDIRETAQVDVQGYTWTVYNAKPDPAGITIIFTLQR